LYSPGLLEALKLQANLDIAMASVEKKLALAQKRVTHISLSELLRFINASQKEAKLEFFSSALPRSAAQPCPEKQRGKTKPVNASKSGPQALRFRLRHTSASSADAPQPLYILGEITKSSQQVDI